MTAKKFWLQTIPSNDCDIVVSFPPDTPESTVAWLQSRIQRLSELTIITRSLTFSRQRAQLASCFAFQITATYPAFLRGLEELHVPKHVKEELGGGRKEFSLTEGGNFHHIEDAEKFLTSADRQSVLLHFLNGLRAEKGDSVGNIKFREGEAIVPKCLSCGIISQVYPLHENNSLEDLQKTWVQKVFGLQPLDKISEYFGIKIAFYFAWLGHYTTALTVPAFVGLSFWVFFSGRDEFVEDIGFVLFSVFNVIWATLYLESWKRRSAELSYEWGTIDNRDEMLSEPRPLYEGEERISEVTGKPEPYYPPWKRNVFRYFVTAPVILFSLLTVFVSVFLILEFQQWMDHLIKDKNYFQCLRYIPKILLAIIIPIFDGFYHRVAVWLNDMENYRTEDTYEDHFVIKLLLFQFVNSFLALFYTAFYLQDMDKLKELLAALLITRQVVGNIKESLIPYAKQQLKLAKMSFDLFGALSPTAAEDNASEVGSTEDYKKTDGDKNGTENSENDKDRKSSGPRQVSQVEVEGSTPQYEGTFDDYLEMFIQFGYVTLFSSAYPLAGLCALLNNLIEVRSDAFKLCFIHQRPFPQRVQNIGSWQTAMEIMGIIGVVVNCGLIGLSGPVHRIFPNITGAQTVILIIVLEHVMLLLKLLISAAIPDIPHSVAQKLAKVEFKRREIERTMNKQRIMEIQGRMDSKDSLSPNNVDLEDKETQCEADNGHTSERKEPSSTPWNRGVGNELGNNEEDDASPTSAEDDAVFRETVSNMKPEEVFNHPRNSASRSRSQSLRSHESPTRRSGTPNFNPSSTITEHGETTVLKQETGASESGILSRNNSLNSNLQNRMKSFAYRQASDSNLLRNVRQLELTKSTLGSTQELSPNSERPEQIFINDVPTPPFPNRTPSKSGPTPPDKRILEQKEFDKKLKAKRDLFSKGRSMSLASFKLPSRLKKSEKSQKSQKLKYYEKEYAEPAPPRGELDFLNMDQLINIKDIENGSSRQREV